MWVCSGCVCVSGCVLVSVCVCGSVLVCVCLGLCWCLGVCGGAPKGGGAKNFALFSLSRHNCLSFFSLLGSFRGILVVFLKRRDPLMCMFGVLGLSCETPAAPGGRRVAVFHKN